MNGPGKSKGILLLVDDEIDFRDTVAEILSPFADEVKVASNGKEALQLVVSKQVDAVISDINMPQMNGLQFLAQVRMQKITTPILMLTAFGDMAAVKEALRLDATDFLEKPCGIEVLRTAAKKALELGLAMREVERQLDELYANSTLPADKVAQIRQFRMITKGMRATFAVYTKKAS